jgi:soluble lytic murein transglycosylase-like protein
MTMAPASVLAVQARIAHLSQPPAAAQRFASMFSAQLVAPTAAPVATPVATAASTAEVAATAVPVLGTTAEVAAVGSGNDASSSATLDTYARRGTVEVGAGWASRLPAAGQPLVGEIEAAAARYGVDPALLAGLVWTESSFRPDVVSSAGAIGLGQLMPFTANSLGVDPWDPAENLDGAARFLSGLIQQFGDERIALAAYNAGPGAVSRAGGVPSENAGRYADTVLERRAILNGTAVAS